MSQPKFMLGFKGPAIGDRDYVVLDLLKDIFFSSSSPLVMKYVQEQKRMTTLGAWQTPWSQPGLLEIEGSISPGQELEKVFADFQKDFFAELEKGNWEKDLQKVKNQTRASFVRGMKSASSKARVLGQYHVVMGMEKLFQLPDLYESITVEDLKTIAKKYFKKEGQNILFIFKSEAKK